MATPKSIRAYDDIEPLFDRALSAPQGVKVSFNTREAATSFRYRANTFRQLDRKRNSMIYSPEHPLFNASAFDVITLKLAFEGNHWYIIFEKNQPIEPNRVEEF